MRRRFPVIGMMCAVCAGTVEKTLRETPGLTSADVNLADATVTVEWNPADTSPEKMREALGAAGYELIVAADEEKALKIQEEEEKNHALSLRRRLIVAWVIAIPLTIACLLHFHAFWFQLASMTGAAFVMIYCAGDFYIRGWKAVRAGRASMDTLVALSTLVSFLFSLFASLFPGFFSTADMTVSLFYDAAAMIPAFVLTGKYMESNARRRTGSALRGLMALQPSEATLLTPGGERRRVRISDIVPSDILLIRPGERIPADGKVSAGESFVDESMLTGESIPVDKNTGDHLFAGTLNGSGSMEMTVEKAGDDSVLADIIRRVRDAQGSKAPVQKIVDKVSSVFVPVVVLIALATFAIWMLSGYPVALAVTTAVSVLVIACPCAMGLATPTALTAGIGRAATYKMLIKDFSALEKVAKIDYAVFDKTGTLTAGTPEIVGRFPETIPAEDYAAILALETRSEHPLAKCLVSGLKDYGAEVSVEDFKSLPGLGVEGSVNGKAWWVGSERLASEKGVKVEIPEALQGTTIIIAGCEDKVCAIFGIEDPLLPDVENVISELRRRGVKTVMLTGDRLGIAERIGQKAGVDEVVAGVLPAEKDEFIRNLRANGHRPAMAGDGINDAGALASSYVSLAMPSGSDIAMNAAEIILMRHDIGLLIKAMNLSGATLRIIRQNLGWALIYNVIAMPVAAGILYPSLGLLLNPMLCSAAMAVSSVCVVLNSLRLKNIKI